MSKFFNKIQNIDIFSEPFQFTFGQQEKKKKTFLGGILSIIVVFLSFMYLIYLFVLYFANSVQPACSTIKEFVKEDYGMQLSEDLMGFKVVLSDGTSLQDYEKKEGKVYLTIVADYKYYEKDGKGKHEAFFTSPCKHNSLEGYLCVDYQKTIDQQSDKFELKYKFQQTEQSKITLLISKCVQELLPSGQFCQENDKIDSLILNISNEFQVKVNLKQYNPYMKQYESISKFEYFLFDDTLAFYSRLTFQSTETRINDGFIVQKTQIDQNFQEYTRLDSTISQKMLEKAFEAKVLGGVLLTLGDIKRIDSVQYIQFTSLFAQFSRFTSKKFAQNEIIQDLISLQLQVYYKKTAFQILKRNQQNKQNYKSGIQIFKAFQNINFKDNITKYLKVGVFQRLKMFMFLKKNITPSSRDSEDFKTYKTLFSSSLKKMDIFEIQKELLQIKMMLRLIFTAEQYAAIQLCGSSVEETQNNQGNVNIDNLQISSKYKSDIELQHSKECFKLDQIKQQDGQKNQQQILGQQNYDQQKLVQTPQLNSITQEKSEIDKLVVSHENHLETMEKIENDQQTLQIYLDKFLQNNNTQSSELDRRIFQSMINYPSYEFQLDDQQFNINK